MAGRRYQYRAQKAPPAEQIDETNADMLAKLAGDPVLAHNYLFAHRHPEPSCSAHDQAIRLLHSPAPRHVLQAFRGFGKSTLVEEAIVIQAAFGRFRNKLIIGASERRAIDRLAAVKHEIDQNEALEYHFGRLRGSGAIWQETKIVLSNGVCIQAVGRDQSLRGVKHIDIRPDSVLVDDIEDKQEVRTPEGRRKTRDWMSKELQPSLDDPVLSPIHVLGTPLDPESLVVELEKGGWPTVKFPIRHRGADGKWRATWPGKFPLSKIEELEKDYRRDPTGFAQEYMLEPVSDADRTFDIGMIHHVQRERSWEAVYVMYDPARTTNRDSATTGRVVWSWVGAKLIIWKSSALKWRPDQIIEAIMADADEFDPVWIAVEQDGLEEFLMQPLRHAQAKRTSLVPIKGVRAPRGKLDFIRALQPFFKAGEVEFVGPGHQDMIDQLLSFPTGAIDAPNALAYALPMRPAAPIYDGFTLGHIVETAPIERSRPCWLACNATRTMVTVVLMQYVFNRLRIIADFAMEGDPAEITGMLVREAGMMSRTALTAVVGPAHYERYTNVGLVQALQKVPLAVERGTGPARGRDVLRAELERTHRGEPTVSIARAARHTLNALAGGYSRQVVRGALSLEAEPGLYRLLMEGVESCLGSMALAEIDEEAHFSYTADGRRYRRYANAMQDRRA